MVKRFGLFAGVQVDGSADPFRWHPPCAILDALVVE